MIWRLAVLFGMRGPWLDQTFLVSGIVRLEQIVAGESTVAIGIDALWDLERERRQHRPASLHERLRVLIGPEVEKVDSLWAIDGEVASRSSLHGRSACGPTRVRQCSKRWQMRSQKRRPNRSPGRTHWSREPSARFRPESSRSAISAIPSANGCWDRRFEAEAPNQRWVGDTTELLIGDSGAKLYLAAIVDLFARSMVGWALSTVNDRHLALKALEMAVRRRCPEAGPLHHSDRGSPYASEDYRDELAAHGIVCSMSRRGNCHDNAAMESWFSTLKFELGERFTSYASAKEKLFDYIEVFYNQQRRHSAIGYSSPADHERSFRLGQLAA